MTSNSILLVSIPQYCAYFTKAPYSAMIRPTKENASFRVQNILEVFPMNKTADRTVALDKGRVDIYTKKTA